VAEPSLPFEGEPSSGSEAGLLDALLSALTRTKAEASVRLGTLPPV
jgi:hypothetical protein